MNKNIIYICEDTQEMPQSRSTSLLRYQKKEWWGTNKENTKVTYETTDTQTKNCNRRAALKRSLGKLLGAANQAYLLETPPPILMLWITNIHLVHIKVLYLSCETKGDCCREIAVYIWMSLFRYKMLLGKVLTCSIWLLIMWVTVCLSVHVCVRACIHVVPRVW